MRVTRVAGPTNAPTLYLFAGGPGLSSLTLRSLNVLARSFNLAYLDYQGTNGTEYDPKLSLLDAADRLSALINEESGPSILAGHSFGGIMAGLCAPQIKHLNGVVMLSVPLSDDAFDLVAKNYRESYVPESASAMAYMESPTLDTFRTWLSSYGTLYFSAENVFSGGQMLRSDPASFPLFYNHRSEIPKLAATVRTYFRVPVIHARALWIADSDGLLPPSIQRQDAAAINAKFELVSDASHFVSFDQPESVARLVENEFATQQPLGVKNENHT